MSPRRIRPARPGRFATSFSLRTLILALLCLVVSGIVVSAAGAAAMTVYVSPSGSDSGDGSSARPYRQIRRALAAAPPGLTVLVADGEYLGFTLEDVHGAAGAPITVRALGQNAVVVPTTDRSYNLDNIVVNYSSWISLDGLRSAGAGRAGVRVTVSPHVTVRNGVYGNNARWGIFTGYSDDLLIEGNECFGSRTEHGIYVSNAGDRPVVRGNWVHDNNAAGIQFNSETDDGSDGLISGAVIENNVVYRNGAAGGAGLALYALQESVVRNNLLWGNHASGIVFWQGDGALGPRDVQVVHNTVDMPADAKWALHFSDTAGPNLVRNNILLCRQGWRGGLRYTTAGDVANVDSDYNLIDRVSDDDGEEMMPLADWRARGHEAHSVTASPDTLWLNPATGDYHLRNGAAAVDRGQQVAGVLVDLEGRVRPAGNAVDLGAFESGSAAAAPRPTLTGWSLSATVVDGGSSLTGTLTLSASAPAGGVVIALASSTGAVQSPTTVSVPAGGLTAVVAIATTAVATDTAATLNATLDGATRGASLTVRAATAPSLSLSIALKAKELVGGATTTGTVTLSGAAPPGGLRLAVSVEGPGVAPASLTVPSGSRTATFTLGTRPVAADSDLRVAVSAAGFGAAAPLSVRTPVPTALGLSRGTARSGQSVTGTVTLNGRAPDGGAVVSLGSSHAAVPVPSTLTVPAGQLRATFSFKAGKVISKTAVSITASRASARVNRTLTVVAR